MKFSSPDIDRRSWVVDDVDSIKFGTLPRIWFSPILEKLGSKLVVPTYMEIVLKVLARRGGKLMRILKRTMAMTNLKMMEGKVR
jgi:hypothetical protein